MWPLPSLFPSGIPGRAEQEIKAGDELNQPHLTILRARPGRRSSLMEQGITREENRSRIVPPRAVSPFSMCLPQLQPPLIRWAEFGAAPLVLPALLAAIPVEFPRLGSPGDSHKVTLPVSLQPSLSQPPSRSPWRCFLGVPLSSGSQIVARAPFSSVFSS